MAGNKFSDISFAFTMFNFIYTMDVQHVGRSFFLCSTNSWRGRWTLPWEFYLKILKQTKNVFLVSLWVDNNNQEIFVYCNEMSFVVCNSGHTSTLVTNKYCFSVGLTAVERRNSGFRNNWSWVPSAAKHFPGCQREIKKKNSVLELWKNTHQ